MKKLLSLLFVASVLLSCENELDNMFPEPVDIPPQTRAVNNIDYNPIKQILGIPVHIKVFQPHSYPYLNCATDLKVSLWHSDDNSGRQRWIFEDATYTSPVSMPLKGYTIRPERGVSGNIAGISWNSFKLSRTLEAPCIFNVNYVKSDNLFTLTNSPFNRILMRPSNYTGRNLETLQRGLMELDFPYSPLNYWVISPIGDWEVVDITYQMEAGDKFIPEVKQVLHRTVSNNTPVAGERTIEISETFESTSTFNRTYGLTVSKTNSEKYKTSIPKIIDGEFNQSITTTNSWSYNEGITEKTALDVKETFKITMGPGATYKVYFIWTNYKLNITYVAALRRAGRTIYVPGKWEGVMVEDLHIDIVDESTKKLIDTRSVDNTSLR